MAGGSSDTTRKPWLQSEMGLGHYTKVRFAIAMACACALVYILSFALMSAHRPCWNPCPPNSCTPLGSPNTPSTPRTSFPEHTLLHPEKESDSALMALVAGGEPNRVLPLTTTTSYYPSASPLQRGEGGTEISRIVFGIAAAADMWSKRKEYIRLWWKSTLRGFVWFDTVPGGGEQWDASFPPWRISQNTSHFEYTYKNGWRSAIRISRIVSETFRLGLPDVDWFVLGDDDTLFFPENLVQLLSKYDHTKMYYIGSNSESHLQNILFSYNMAFGGGGFAISYPLAKLLAKMQDSCLARFHHLSLPFFHGFSFRSNLLLVSACSVCRTVGDRGLHTKVPVLGKDVGNRELHSKVPVLVKMFGIENCTQMCQC